MSSSSLRLRPIADEDLPFLYALYASTRIHEMAQTGWAQPAIDAFLAQQFQAQHNYYQEHYQGADFSVICQNDAPIGRLYVYRGPTTLNLIDIALLPQWRDQGIGSHYLTALIREADEMNKAIRLFVEPTNAAKRLYVRLGFAVTDSNHVYLQMERQPIFAAQVSI